MITGWGHFLKTMMAFILDLNYNLGPACDLLASELVVEYDDEELALNLIGKKKKLKRRDFSIAMKLAG